MGKWLKHGSALEVRSHDDCMLVQVQRWSSGFRHRGVPGVPQGLQSPSTISLSSRCCSFFVLFFWFAPQ